MATNDAPGKNKRRLYVGSVVIVVVAAGAYWYTHRDAPTATQVQAAADDQQAYQEPSQDEPSRPTTRPAPSRTIDRERPPTARPKTGPEDSPKLAGRRPKPKAPTKINTSPRK